MRLKSLIAASVLFVIVGSAVLLSVTYDEFVKHSTAEVVKSLPSPSATPIVTETPTDVVMSISVVNRERTENGVVLSVKAVNVSEKYADRLVKFVQAELDVTFGKDPKVKYVTVFLTVELADGGSSEEALTWTRAEQVATP